jgi:putative phosphoesterase
MSRIRIAVLADTHNRLPSDLVKQLAPADAIWHLGDVMNPATLEPLERLAIPLLIIRGNNDFSPYWPQHRLLEFGTKRFLLIHIAPRNPKGCDVLLHGHTHVPRDEQIEGIRHLNPGTAGLPNKGAPKSFAWLDLDPETGEFDWQLVLL